MTDPLRAAADSFLAVEGEGYPNLVALEAACKAYVEALGQVAQKDGPKAWRVKDKNIADGWFLCRTEAVAKIYSEQFNRALIQPLYALTNGAKP